MDSNKETIYSKTAKGIDAVRKGGGLSKQEKALLQAVDGVKDLSALRSAVVAAGVSATDFQSALKQLHQAGYLQSQTPAPATATAAAAVVEADNEEVEKQMLVTLDFTQQVQDHKKKAAEFAVAAKTATSATVAKPAASVTPAERPAPARQTAEDAQRQHEELARQATAARMKIEADVRQKLVVALQPRVEEELRGKLRPKLEEELRPKLIATLRPGIEAELRAKIEQEIAPRVELELKSRFAKNLAAQTRAGEVSAANDQSAVTAAAPVAPVQPPPAPAQSGANERLLASIGSPIFTIDMSGKCTYMSPAWVQLAGYTGGEAIGKPLVDFFAESDRRGLGNMLRGVCEGTALRFEHQGALQRKDAAPLWVEVSAAPLYSPGGEVAGASGLVRDATEVRRFEEDAESSGVKLLLLVDQIDTGVVIEDREGNIQQANPAFCALLSPDTAPASLEGMPVVELFDQVAEAFVDRVGYIRRMGEIRSGEDDVKGEVIMLADGRMIEQDCLAVIAGDSGAGRIWLFRAVRRRQ